MLPQGWVVWGHVQTSVNSVQQPPLPDAQSSMYVSIVAYIAVSGLSTFDEMRLVGFAKCFFFLQKKIRRDFFVVLLPVR